MSLSIEQINQTAQLSENNQLSLMIFQANFSAPDLEKPPYFGVNVFKVREVLEGRVYPVSKMPESNHLVEGMIELRGTYLPVIALPAWLGRAMTEEEIEKSVIIVCDFSKNFVGLRVAHIHGVEEKFWSDIKLASNYDMNVDHSKIINHTHLKDSDELAFILDIERMLLDAMPTLAHNILKDIESLNDKKAVDIRLSERIKQKTIYFAEDSRAIQQYMKSVFTSLELPFKMFENGRLLLDDILRYDSVDDISCVFTDLEMPLASGYTVIKELRSSPIARELPIVVHTSMTSGDNTREALKLGADYFIGKVDTKLILQVLEKIDQA